MMAIQASSQDIGPGVEQMKKEKLRKMDGNILFTLLLNKCF